jgi:hypothetical protein
MSNMGSHDPFGHLKHKLWSNHQFDSQPLKVRDCPNSFVCRWRATYHWKDLTKGYNFDLDLISIIGLHTKLWALKVTKVLVVGISGQNSIWMLVPWLAIK